MGNYGIYTHDFRLATRNLNNAVKYARQAGDNQRVYLALCRLSNIRISQDRYAEAWKYAQSAYQTAINIPNGRMTLFSLSSLGTILLHKGKIELARDYFLQAIAIEDDTIQPKDKISPQNYLALIHYLLNETTQAYQMWQTALKTGIESQSLSEVTRSLVGLVALHPDKSRQKERLATIVLHPDCHWEAENMALWVMNELGDKPILKLLFKQSTPTTTLLDIAHELLDKSS